MTSALVGKYGVSEPAAVRRVARAHRGRREGAERRAGDGPGRRGQLGRQRHLRRQQGRRLPVPGQEGPAGRHRLPGRQARLDARRDADAHRVRRQAARLQRRLQRPRPAHRLRRPGRRRLLRQRPRPVLPRRVPVPAGRHRPAAGRDSSSRGPSRPASRRRSRVYGRNLGPGVEAESPGRSATWPWRRRRETVTAPADVLARGAVPLHRPPDHAQRPADGGDGAR